MIILELLLVAGLIVLWRRVNRLEAALRQIVEPAPISAALPADQPPLPDPAAVAPDTAQPERPGADLLAAAMAPPPAPPVTEAQGENPQTGPQDRTEDRAIVFRRDRFGDLARWLRDNWVYVVSAISLALAGVFFVQYGVENGLLPPYLRVMAAIALGAALIFAGEWVRRRHGDGENASSAYIPSTLSGAGMISVFAGILAARQLYGLIGIETAFAGLAGVAVLAIVLGWFHGPFLTAVGLTGATVTPFVIGGAGPAPDWFYGYFTLLAAAGLAVDALRRWGWISVLALALAFGAGWLVLQGGGSAAGFAPMLLALAALAIALPPLRLIPVHDGPMITEALLKRGGWPSFPTRLAGGTTLASAVSLFLIIPAGPVENGLVYLCLGLLALGLLLWAQNAPALRDLTFVPIAVFLLALVRDGETYAPLARDFAAQALDLRAAETGAPMTASLLLGLATLFSLFAALRSFRDPDYKAVWALGAVLTAPVAGLLLEVFWAPAAVIGAFPWALHAAGLAALMVVLAERFARIDGADHRRAAYATLSAMALIAFALGLVLSSAALTLALAVQLVVAAALDKRFRLPEMGLFIPAGVAVIGYRLTIDPGLDYGFSAALGQVLATYGGAIAAMAAGLWLLRGLPRLGAQLALESGLVAAAAILANLLLVRWIDGWGDDADVLSHWSLTLNALPWLVMMLVQAYRMQLGGPMWYVRLGLACLGALFGFAGLIAAAGPLNPLFDFSGPVRGPLLLDTMFVAYLLPGILLLAALPRLGHLRAWIRLAFGGIGGGLVLLYLGLEIRRFWRGADMALPGIGQGELYSYTLALMLIGAALLYQAIARHSTLLRRAAMGVIALTVAKVFLIDASGLSGLTRVVSFLALGLSLAGLAWLNRWAAGQQGGPLPELPKDAEGATPAAPPAP